MSLLEKDVEGDIRLYLSELKRAWVFIFAIIWLGNSSIGFLWHPNPLTRKLGILVYFQQSPANQWSSEGHGKNSRLIIPNNHVLSSVMLPFCWKGGLRVLSPLPECFLLQKLNEGTSHLKSGTLLGCRMLNCDKPRKFDPNVLRLGWRYKKPAYFLFIYLFITVPRASNSKNGFYWNIACAKNKLWACANYEKLKLKQAYFMSTGKMLLMKMIYGNCFAAAILMVCIQSCCHVFLYSNRSSSGKTSYAAQS